MDKSKVEQTVRVKYRKMKHGREFYKITDAETMRVVTVTNRHYESSIKVQEAATGLLVAGSIKYDDQLYCDCSEAEFNVAYSDALAIVTMKKIP